jgi:ribosomal-protein-serine acetyltransferase
MTRAARALVDYGFGELGLHRIVIRCATGNHASRAIPERLGFALEGTLRQAQWVNDHFNDLAVYAMLRPDWDRAS